MERENKRFLRGLIGTVAVFVLLVCAALALVKGLSDTSEEAQLTMVRDAIKSALVTCYATEGSYPQSVDYLKEHYGLAFDEERFFVYYDAFASNILPDVRVTVKGAGIP